MAETVDDFSRAFYPFLHESEVAPQQLMEELRFSLLEKSRESNEVKNRFFDENKDEILAAALALARAFHRGRRMFVCGNGGSATDAQHVAVEFMHPITVGRRALPVISLANDIAMLTAVANDVGIAQVFSRQLIAHAAAGDILLAISTSGNSANLIDAFETARRMKLTTIGFAGGDGGRMLELHAQGSIDFCLVVPTASIHRVQETHVALYHIIWDLVHELLPHRALMEESE
jgi:D-sedoheptulose 7-phosphate isomerase